MTYTERLTEIAEKMAKCKLGTCDSPAQFRKMVTHMMPLAAICLEETAKEAKQFYRNSYQDCGNNMPPDSKPYLDNSGLIP